MPSPIRFAAFASIGGIFFGKIVSSRPLEPSSMCHFCTFTQHHFVRPILNNLLGKSQKKNAFLGIAALQILPTFDVRLEEMRLEEKMILGAMFSNPIGFDASSGNKEVMA